MPHNIPIYSLQNFAPMIFTQLRDKMFENYENGVATDEELAQLIELATSYLNLKTITNYARANKISYNGALKRKLRRVTIDKVVFIIDNE